jgi:ADP-ribose pyrophosphatase YjhB (NUDIX family)
MSGTAARSRFRYSASPYSERNWPIVLTPLEETWARASKSITAAALILNRHGEVLLVRHSYGRLNWELPGGAAERDESPTETAVREVLEETGLRVTPERLTGVYYERQNDTGREVVHFAFVCRALDEGAAPQPSCPEIMACSYWSADALPCPISDFTIRRIRDGLTNTGLMLPVAITARHWLT